MPERNLEFGKIAEKAAAEFLKASGYKLLEVNYKTRLGEVDIIALDKDVICFVEVKARHSLEMGWPQEAVFLKKQRQISRAAINYLKAHKLLEKAARFDIVTLLYAGNKPEISLIKNAFELSPNFTL